MTKFEDRLFGQLMAEHGHPLRALERPAPARRPARRRVGLASGAAGTVAAVTAAVMALGSAPASAAYSVTRHANGTVTVSVNRLSGVAGANAALHAMRARVVVVPVRPGCPLITSLPRPHPAPHPYVSVAAGVTKNGHRSVTVKLGKGGIPKGDTMILAFTGSPRHGTALGAGGIITGRVPRCVSLPPRRPVAAAPAQPVPSPRPQAAFNPRPGGRETMSVAGRGIRNAFRNVTRTVSIILILGLAIGLAFVMLIAHRSVSDKIASTLSSIGNTVTIGPPGYSAGGLLGKSLTAAELAPIARLHGVTGIDESLNGAAQTLGTAQNGCPKGARCHGAGGRHSIKLGSTSLKSPMSLAARRAGLACAPKPCTPPVTGSQQVYFSGSTQPANPVNIGASTLRIVSGHAISGTSPADVAMVSTAMARKNGLKVGSAFTGYGTTFTVAAIFDSDSQSAGNTVVTSLPVLQRLTGDTGRVFSAVVTVASLTELATVTSAIERTLGPEASLVSYTADAGKAAGSLDSVKGIALYSLAGAVGAAAVILLLVMVMIVRERKREIGILKAIGASNGRIMAQFTTEAVTFTLLGWVVGLVAGLAAASPVTSALVSHSGVSSDTGARGLFGAPSPFLSHLTGINAQVGWGVILGALAAAVVVAVLASAATTWMIGRIRPAEVLRSE